MPGCRSIDEVRAVLRRPLVVNRDSPIGNGLVGFFVKPTSLSRPVEITNAAVAPSSGENYTFLNESRSFGVYNSTAKWTERSTAFKLTSPLTLVGVGRLTVNGITASTFPELGGRSDYTDETTNAGYQLQLRPGGESNVGCLSLFANNAQASYQLNTTTQFTTARDFVLAGTYDGTTGRVFVNGVQENSRAMTAPGVSTSAVFMGPQQSAAGEVYTSLFAVYSKVLAPYALSMFNDPSRRWDAIWRKRRSAYKAPAAASVFSLQHIYRHVAGIGA